MKKNLLDIIRCPKCQNQFIIENPVERRQEIYSATLKCSNCHSEFPVSNYIPRLIKGYNYSDSWGKLWQETANITRDSATGIPFYYNVIHGRYSESGKGEEGASPFGFEWPLKMEGEFILEVGPGTGCCTEHLVKTEASIVSVDMSNAIDTFPEELLTSSNLNVVQGDINQGVIRSGMFDKIWLFQVLQHTPSPAQTLKTMHGLLREAGEIAFTSYKGHYDPWYYRLIKKMDPQTSWELINYWIPILVPIRYRIQKFFYVLKMPFLAKVFRKVTEPVDPRNTYFQTVEGLAGDYVHGILWERTKDKQLLLKQIVLNTFDTITPQYTNSANHDVIERWAKEAGFSTVFTWGKSGVRAKARK